MFQIPTLRELAFFSLLQQHSKGNQHEALLRVYTLNDLTEFLSNELLERLLEKECLVKHEYETESADQLIVYQQTACLITFFEEKKKVKPVETPTVTKKRLSTGLMKRTAKPSPATQQLNKLKSENTKLSDKLRQIQILQTALDPVEYDKLTQSIKKWKSVAQQVAIDLLEKCQSAAPSAQQQSNDSNGYYGQYGNDNEYQQTVSALSNPFQYDPEGSDLYDARREQENDHDYYDGNTGQAAVENEMNMKRMFQALQLDLNLLDYDSDQDAFSNVN